jgi:putative sterol carrier protein
MIDSIKQLFAEIPSRFDAAKWGSDDAVLQFNVQGDESGGWTAAIAGGKLTITQGVAPQPSMALTCTDKDLLAMVNGELNAVSAFMQGKVKIEGNMSLAIKLQGLLAAEQG